MHHGEVRRVVGIAQIGIEVQQLSGREHALVDEHLARQAAHIEILRLAQRGVAAQAVARTLAQQIQLALERVAVEAVACRDEQLFDMRCGCACAVANVGRIRVRRHYAPANDFLLLFGADLGHDGLATLALGGVGR